MCCTTCCTTNQEPARSPQRIIEVTEFGPHYKAATLLRPSLLRAVNERRTARQVWHRPDAGANVPRSLWPDGRMDAKGQWLGLLAAGGGRSTGCCCCWRLASPYRATFHRSRRPPILHYCPRRPARRSLDDANIDYFYLYTVASRFNLVAVRP